MESQVLKSEKVGLYTIEIRPYYSDFHAQTVFIVCVPKANQAHPSSRYGVKYYQQHKTVEAAEADFNKQVAYYTKLEETKAARRQERSAKQKFAREEGAKSVKVGEIYNCSWGYSMTFNDFYQVIEVKNKTVEVVKLGSEILTGEGYSGTERPIPITEVPIGAEILKARIIAKGCISVKDSRSRSDKAYLTSPEKTHYYNRMD